jgi:hypothetical protein
MIEVRDEVTMPRTRRTPWQEPDRHGLPPTLDVEEVRKWLGFKNAQSVHNLANRGPENGGLQAYVEVKQPNGYYKWAPKPENLPGGRGWREMFYEEDVADWDRRHPYRVKDNDTISYTDEERTFVLGVARSIQDEVTGVVQRTKLINRLAELQGSRIWNARSYSKLKKILDDAGIPGGIQHDPSPRRRRTGNG